MNVFFWDIILQHLVTSLRHSKEHSAFNLKGLDLWEEASKHVRVFLDTIKY